MVWWGLSSVVVASASRHPSLVVQHALAAVRTGAELNISAYLADYADFGVRSRRRLGALFGPFVPSGDAPPRVRCCDPREGDAVGCSVVDAGEY